MPRACNGERSKVKIMVAHITTPVTVITGFLGSGKTTLLNRVLRELHGERLAVIENEFGAVGVDAEFLVTGGNETIIQLANGCLCCTVRGDLAKSLQTLSTSAEAGGFVFDRVLIETTGIADPGPVIQTFLAETAILTKFHLDGVIALVDSVHFFSQLDRVENKAQIAYADRLLLTKCDLVTSTQLEAVESRLVDMNPRAELLPLDLHHAPIADVLKLLFDASAYSFDYVPLMELKQLHGYRMTSGNRYSHVVPHHTGDVVSCVFESDRPLDLERLNQFFDVAQRHYGPRLWRYKGIVFAEHQRPRLVVQGVQSLLQITGGTIWRAYEPRRTLLVFIGQEIEPDWIEQGLRLCEVASV
ncbi:putative P-loop guanosine triphosphatase YjiA [Georgfuchsia toluolica]|uniref:P-loop guanosine triphosphatase YjiA n=1 Tax=Georgfuchsia toluolica TaxID=424218 RepID=A0A916J7K7_9PROT|nr:GTP-binding protein [Georgfuchsia toluolica]CAG4883881.1 putative P-loop guanosine triphosphatase YjiA [Georgfuchsia toluolica]